MGPKKDTLLRWVNCCFEAESSVDQIKNLSNGGFFIYILGSLRSHYVASSSPWLHIIAILRDYGITDDIIDYDAAALGNEDELGKLVIVSMYLTMVKEPCETIKEKTMINLPADDQKVVESILTAIVNDDSVTRERLCEVLQDTGVESSHSKPMTFYSSSPLSSMPRNSPLKRFLDSPMALRLSRLQREINDKNEEIRRLQSEIITESDESTALRLQLDELNRRVKEMEKRNIDLTQRLRDCQIPESLFPGADVEINQLKKQLKKLQSEYELSCQRYCDLNLEHESLKARQEKDRRQIRQLQMELNEAVSRFERESAEYQLLLDSIRTENFELKHTLDEKIQWIDVLEERNRNCSETHSQTVLAPTSPCPRESIGFSLLSIESEKLQFEVETYRKELATQTSSFEIERSQYEQQVVNLKQENSHLVSRVEESLSANKSLHSELQHAKSCLDQLTQGCNSLRDEKNSLVASFESLKVEFKQEMERAQHQIDARTAETQELEQRIESLNEQIGATLSLKGALEKSVQTLEKEKLEIAEKLEALGRTHSILESVLSAKELEYNQYVEKTSSEIEHYRSKINHLESTAHQLESDRSLLSHEKENLESEILNLKLEIQKSTTEFEARLNLASVNLEEASSRITELTNSTAILQSQLDEALEGKEHFEKKSAELEIQRAQLLTEREELQKEVTRLLTSVQVIRGEFVSEKNELLEELDSKKKEIEEKMYSIQCAEERHDEAIRKISCLEETIHSLEVNAKDILESKICLEQQTATLQAAVEAGKSQLEAMISKAKMDAESYEQQIHQSKDEHASLTARFESVKEEKANLEKQVTELGGINESFQHQISSLQQAGDQLQKDKNEALSKLFDLQEESKQVQEKQQQVIRDLSDKICKLEEKLSQSVQHQNNLNSCLKDVSDEKLRVDKEKQSLTIEISRLTKSLEEERNTFEASLVKMKADLEIKQTVIDEAHQKIQLIETELIQITSQRDSSESRVQQLVDERNVLLQQRASLELDTQLLKNQQSEHIEFVNQLNSEHEERIQKLTTELETMQQRSAELSNKCVQLECEREALNFEKCNFEQMYSEVRAACDEAEAKILVESELAKREIEAKNLMMQQHSEELSSLHQTIVNLRHEKDAVESSQIQRIAELEGELQILLDNRSSFEQERFTLISSSETALKDLENQLTIIKQQLLTQTEDLQKTNSLRKEAEEQRDALAVALEKLKFEAQSETVEKNELIRRFDELQHAHAEALRANEEKVKELSMEIAAKQQQVDEERETLRATEDLLHNSNFCINDLEVNVEQLTLEIQELSCKKANLEQRCDYLENSKAAAEEEATQLREELESKSPQIMKLAEKITLIENELEQAKQDNQHMKVLLKTKDETTETNVQLKEKISLQEEEFHKEKKNYEKTIAKHELKIEELNVKLLDSSKAYDEIKDKYFELRETYQSIVNERISIEEDCRKIQDKLESTRHQFEDQLKKLELQLSEKDSEILQLSNLNASLEEQIQLKRAFEEKLTEQLSSLSLEKDTLQNKTVSLEEECHLLKTDLLAEKEKSSLHKCETSLEYRTEKAVLEAKLQLANSQVRSMQEKLVNMTFSSTNNSSFASLEQKVSSLTSELNATLEAKNEMEKRLKEAVARFNENNEEPKHKKNDCASDSEIAVLRQKYESTKKTLIYKEEVINQYANKFEKMQSQLDAHSENMSALTAENRKLAFENRSLKTEQQHLLAQIAAEKDKATAKASRHSLALQRGLAASDGGTLADAMIDARRRTLRSTRSEVVTSSRRPPEEEVFRPPSLAFGDGSDASSIFKVPPSRRESFNRRDSVNSVCSTRSDASSTSRLNVPQGSGRFFTCDDEDGEQFSNLYLNEMKEGKCKVEDNNARLSELHRRNTMQPPHMRSAYPAEINDERLRSAELPAVTQQTIKTEELNDSVNQLSLATSMLSVDTPPALNTRKRRSSSWNVSNAETPVIHPTKRRSQEDANMSTDSGHSTNRSIMSSAERKKHRDSSHTTYQRPGPPTPAKNPLKESNSILSNNSSPKLTPKHTPKLTGKLSSKQSTPSQPSRSAKLTPGALVRKVQAKIRSNKQMASAAENTPSTTPRSRTKLNIFRKPLGSRGYSSDAKF